MDDNSQNRREQDWPSTARSSPQQASGDESIGDRIKHARKSAAFSQSDLAERVGVSQPTVANWESGIHDPRRLMLAKLSETLKVPLTWLSEGARSATEADTHAAAAYLRRYLQHVPVISQDAARQFMEPSNADPHDFAEDYIPVTYGQGGLFALFVTDHAIDRAFPPDTLVVIDYEDRKPVEGTYCLAVRGETCMLRRWHQNPARLEPHSTRDQYTTFFLDQGSKSDEPPVTILGCVRVSIRFH
ncbi:MAG: helix-turn-helix domain-containing protein [Pseudomonadota bacterium]